MKQQRIGMESPNPNPGSTLRQDIHLIPLGFDYDRAVLPFLRRQGRPPFFHAHRFHLIAPDTQRHRSFLAKVQKTLAPLAPVKRHIIPRVDPRSGRLVEYPRSVRLLSRICQEELAAGARVHINLSTGTKLYSIAAALVGMAYLSRDKGSAYYVLTAEAARSDEDFGAHGLQKGLLDVQIVDLIPLLLPDPLRFRVLAFLGHRDHATIEYRELLQFLEAVPGAGFGSRASRSPRVVRDRMNALTTKMVRTILSPLAAAGLIEIRGMGRARGVRLSPHGRLYADLAALEPQELRKDLPN